MTDQRCRWSRQHSNLRSTRPAKIASLLAGAARARSRGPSETRDPGKTIAAGAPRKRGAERAGRTGPDSEPVGLCPRRESGWRTGNPRSRALAWPCPRSNCGWGGPIRRAGHHDNNRSPRPSAGPRAWHQGGQPKSSRLQHTPGNRFVMRQIGPSHSDRCAGCSQAKVAFAPTGSCRAHRATLLDCRQQANSNQRRDMKRRLAAASPARAATNGSSLIARRAARVRVRGRPMTLVCEPSTCAMSISPCSCTA